MPTVCPACISGVPSAGLPNTMSLMGGNVRPTDAALAWWSSSATMVRLGFCVDGRPELP